MLILFVVSNYRRSVSHRLCRVDDCGQRFVVDDDRLARVLGDVGIVGDDARYFLPLESDLVGCEDSLGVVGQRRHPGQVATRHQFTGEHEANSRDRPRRAGIDGLYSGMGERAAEDLHVQHAGQGDVVDVVALTADESVVLDAATAGPEPADLDLVDGHDVSPSSWSVAPWLRSRAAAASTDFTMF